EDGIRDRTVTGVQTCALPICPSAVVLTEPVPELLEEIGWTGGEAIADGRMFLHYFRTTADGRVVMGSGSGPIGHGGAVGARFFEIGRASCRERAGIGAVDGRA